MTTRGRVAWLALVWGVALCVAGSATAAEPSLEVRLEPQRLGVEDLARLVITIHEPGRATPTPNLGALENFQVVSGPSTENRFTLVNGTATSELAVTYILQPQAVGAARVGPFTVQVGAAKLTSGVLNADVVAGSVAPQRPARRSPSPFNDPFGFPDPFAELAQQQRPAAAQGKIFLRQLVNRRDIVRGQPILVTLALDTNVSGIEGFEWVTAPTFPGWWTQAVEHAGEVRAEVVEVDGERFQRYVVGQFVLIPLKAGTMTLPAAEVRVGVRNRSLFGRQQVVERASEAIPVEVRELPPPPVGFAGAVGALRYQLDVTPETLTLGDSVVLTMTVEGSGNLALIEAPSVWPSCSSCDTYPPEEEDQVVVSADGMRGRRSWRQTVLPRSSGELHLAPVTVAVFDPASGSYQRQTLGPVTLSVAPPPTPTLTAAELVAAEVAVSTAPASGDERAAAGPVDLWLWLAAALFLGAAAGAGAVWLVLRRGRSALPPRRHGQSPSERAKELQVALETWWLEARESAAAGDLAPQVEQLRRDLETVRFAPGRADHTETVRALETRLGEVLRAFRRSGAAA